MAKKQYMKPVLMYSGLDDESDVVIVIGGSQGTSGYDSQYKWDESIADLIGAYDDIDLAAMDTDGDYYITEDEFNAFVAENN